MLMCFDFLVNGNSLYPDIIGGLYEDPERLEHLKSMKKQVKFHVKNINHKFVIPGENYNGPVDIYLYPKCLSWLNKIKFMI